MELHSLNNFERGQPKEHFYEFSLNLVHWFRRKISEQTDRQTTTSDSQWLQQLTWSLCSGELKAKIFSPFATMFSIVCNGCFPNSQSDHALYCWLHQSAMDFQIQVHLTNSAMKELSLKRFSTYKPNKTNLLTPCPAADTFCCICSRKLLKTLLQREKLYIMSNISFCHNVFNSFQ